jgi:anti-sigma regulatory factor (Ser/Thr protein kinase)
VIGVTGYGGVSVGGHVPVHARPARPAGGGMAASLSRRPAERTLPSHAVPWPGRSAESPGREWPLRDFIELGALDSSVPCARYHTRQILWEWGLTGLADSVELVVAELMTNAVSASCGLEWPSPVRLWLLSDRSNVLVVVWDADPRAPALIEAAERAELAESGRGLILVDAVSARWDWYTTPGAAGKVVHALITG